MSIYRRTDDEPSGAGVDALLARAREGLRRVTPVEAAAERDAGAMLVDIRPEVNREGEGLIPGALVIDRNVLEWRLDPTGRHRLPVAGDPERRIIVFCNEGYASSLAAASLREIGLSRATDLIGGYRAWRESGLPTVRAGG